MLSQEAIQWLETGKLEKNIEEQPFQLFEDSFQEKIANVKSNTEWEFWHGLEEVVIGLILKQNHREGFKQDAL